MSYPNSGSFAGTNEHIYDPTIIWCIDQAAAGLISYLVPPTETWAQLGLLGAGNRQLETFEIKKLQSQRDIFLAQTNLPESRFHLAAHEAALDKLVFGTSNLNVDFDKKLGILKFSTHPITQTYFLEDKDENPSTVFLVCPYTSTKLVEFKKKRIIKYLPPQIIKDAEKGLQNTYEVVKVIRPNINIHKNFIGAEGKPFIEYIWIPSENFVCDKRGVDFNKNHISRWDRFSGELWGDSPTKKSLHTVRLVNRIWREFIAAAEFNNRPILLVEQDSYLSKNPLKPGGIGVIENLAQNKPMLITPAGKIEITEGLVVGLQNQIKQLFFLDWLFREQKKERQSQLEITDERNQMLRQLAPIIARIQTEELTRVIKTSLYLLRKNGVIPKELWLTDSVDDLSVTYTGPAARALSETKANNIHQFLMDLAQVAPIFPAAHDSVKMDKLLRMLATIRDVPVEVLNTDSEIKKLQSDRANQQKQMEMVAAAQPLAAATKDLAIAKEKGF